MEYCKQGYNFNKLGKFVKKWDKVYRNLYLSNAIKIEDKNYIKFIRSYETIIGYIFLNKKLLVQLGDYSKTSTRHINMCCDIGELDKINLFDFNNEVYIEAFCAEFGCKSLKD